MFIPHTITDEQKSIEAQPERLGILEQSMQLHFLWHCQDTRSCVYPSHHTACIC